MYNEVSDCVQFCQARAGICTYTVHLQLCCYSGYMDNFLSTSSTTQLFIPSGMAINSLIPKKSIILKGNALTSTIISHIKYMALREN